MEEDFKTIFQKPASEMIKRAVETIQFKSVMGKNYDTESFLCNYLQMTYFFIKLDESTL